MVFFNTTMRCVRPEHVGNCSTRPRTSKPRTPNRVEPVAPVPSHSHVAAFYCVQGLRRALRYRPRRHRARCHRARRPLLLLSLAWPPPPSAPLPSRRVASLSLRLCLLTCGCFFIACRVCVALSGIDRPRRHRARCHRARRPLLLLSLAWPPPPFRASAVAPRCLALHRVWVRLCGRCGVTVLVCCIRPPAFSIALPAPAIAWARTAARQCCLK